MNATHAAVGVAAGSVTGALTTLLTGWHGLDAAHASAAAFLITTTLGVAGALLVRFIPPKAVD